MLHHTLARCTFWDPFLPPGKLEMREKVSDAPGNLRVFWGVLSCSKTETQPQRSQKEETLVLEPYTLSLQATKTSLPVPISASPPRRLRQMDSFLETPRAGTQRRTFPPMRRCFAVDLLLLSQPVGQDGKTCMLTKRHVTEKQFLSKDRPEVEPKRFRSG